MTCNAIANTTINIGSWDLEGSGSLPLCSEIARLNCEILDGRPDQIGAPRSGSRVDARPWFVGGPYLVQSPTHGYDGPRFILELSVENELGPTLVGDFSGNTVHFFL